MLPQNKASFGLHQGLKFRLHKRTCHFFHRQNLANLVSSCSESREDSKTIKINWKGHRTWLENGKNHCGYSSSRTAYNLRRSPSEDETLAVRSPAAALPHGLANVWLQGLDNDKMGLLWTNETVNRERDIYTGFLFFFIYIYIYILCFGS